MSGRNRGRPRGRPKTGGGRGRGRGRASQTDESLSVRSLRSPCHSTKTRGESGQHLNTTPPSFSHTIHPGAPPGTYSYSLPPGLQPPGLPHSFSHLPSADLSMPRGSSHSKCNRHDDQSPGRVNSGMQTSLQTGPLSGLSSSRHNPDSSRHASGSKQSLDSNYGRQNVDHAVGDSRYLTDHQVRPSARKAHRQARDFPFQEEFEPTYSGLKEKRLSQKQSGDKAHKDLSSHRAQFQNVDTVYPKQKKDSSYFDPKHDKDQLYSNRRLDRDPSYNSPRLERDQRYANSRHDRDALPPAARRGRDSPFCLQRQETSHRSSSTDSNQSGGSQYADSASPQCSPSPSVGYHSQGVQPYLMDSRNPSGERDSGFSKHRDYSGERYAPNMVSFASSPMRQCMDAFSDPIPRENTFSPSNYASDNHVHSKMGCSGKTGKANKSGAMHPSYGPNSASDNIPSHRMFSYAGHPDAQTDSRACMDLPLKKMADMGGHGRSGSLDRNFNGLSDREKPTSRKKQTTRNQPPDQQMPLQNPHHPSYLPPSPYYGSGYPAETSSAMPSACGSIRVSNDMRSTHCEDDFTPFRPAKQHALPSRPRRPSTSGSPSPSPPPPPLYPSRSLSPPSFPSKRASSRHQQIQSQESDSCRRSVRLAQNAEADCHNAASSPTKKLPQSRRGKNEDDDSPDRGEPPPLIEPMAFQQQFLKHLQEQEQHSLQDSQLQDEPMQQPCPRKQGKKDSSKISYEDKRQQMDKEQQRKQDEQMCQDFIKFTWEKVQREHRKQLERLQLEHTRQMEQMQGEHATQLQRQTQRDHTKHQAQAQRERFLQEEERLQREQLKQLDKMRRDQMKEIEWVEREHALLEQKYLDRDQDSLGREQQVLTQKEPFRGQHPFQQQKQYQQDQSQHQQQSEDEDYVKTSQRQLPDYIKQRYEHIQKQQDQLYQQRCEQDKPPQGAQQMDQHVNQYTHDMPLPQFQQSDRTKDHRHLHHQQQPYHQQSHHQSGQVPQGSWQQQQQQQMLRVQQQQQTAQQNQNCEQLQYQMPQGHPSAYSLHVMNREQLPPIPPWRQGTVNREPSGPIAHQTSASGQTKDSSQAVSPARLPPQNNQSTSPVRQPHQDIHTSPIRALPPPISQTHQSPARQMPFPHHGNQMVSMSGPSIHQPMSSLNTSHIQTSFPSQYASQAASCQRNQTMPQTNSNFQTYTSTPVAAASETQGSQSKKPPWLIDCENQVLQRKPPWQQQQSAAAVYVMPTQDVSRNSSQYTGSAASSTADQYQANMSAPPALTRLTTTAQMQGTHQHKNGGEVQSAPHQTSLPQTQQQTLRYPPPHNGSRQEYQTSYNNVQRYNSSSHSSVQSSVCSQTAVPHYSGSLARHQYTHLSTQGQSRAQLCATGNQNQPSNMHQFPNYSSTDDPPKPHPYFSNMLEQTNEANYQYQTQNGYSGAAESQPVFAEAPTDQECAQQILVEALNEQMNQSKLQTSEQSATVGTLDQTRISVEMHSQQTIVTTPHSQQHTLNTSGLPTYTLHHLFDDAHKLQHSLQTPPALLHKSCVLNPIQQGQFQPSAMDSSHQPLPDNPLDAAVAMLNIQESVLDIPSVEQHQVFVLEPPSRQQPGNAANTALRRNSWHTPENSSAGSRTGSFGDEDVGLFNDITADLAEDDDDIFLPPQPAPKPPPDSKVLLQNSVKISSMGISDLGLRISSVFSLAATRRRKRRTLSDSVLQEVEVVSRQEGLTGVGMDESSLVNKSSNSQHNLSQEPYPMHPSNSETCFKDFNILSPADQKFDSFENDMSCSSPDPLAQLTKLLFTDMAVPSPGATAVEDWNLNEAAGVSFEADSVCVPGTPARGDLESFATPIPHLYTPMPQVGTPRPCPSRDPATPFSRYSSIPQTIKMPATPLSTCTKEAVTASSGKASSSFCLKDFKEPQTPWPFPVKEFKEPDTPLSSCAWGPSTPLPTVPVKTRDPSLPFARCAKTSSTALDLGGKQSLPESQLSCNRTGESQSTENLSDPTVDSVQKTITENGEKASKQPLEQAIRELLGDDPIEKTTDQSFENTKLLNTNGCVESTTKLPQKFLSGSKESKQRESSHYAQTPNQQKENHGKTACKRPLRTDRNDTVSKQPQRKSERLSAKEVTTTNETVSNRCSTTHTEKDIRDRVSDNWERRCVSKTISLPSTVSSRSRDSSRESEKDRRIVTPMSEANVSRGLQKNKSSLSKSVDSAMELAEEDRKSCGVRGRRTITLASKKKTTLDRQCSTEDSCPEQKQTSSDHKSHETEKHGKKNESSEVEKGLESKCMQETSQKAEDTVVDDMDQDVFFPDLSPSDSTDDNVEEETVQSNEKRRRLSSCDSELSRRSSVSSYGEGVGESIADLILPTVLPPFRRPRKNDKTAADSEDLLATFHDHELKCVQLEGENYIVLEELLTKCFPGLPRSQVERARVRDLNLLTRTVHLLGPDVAGNEDAMTVLLLQDAGRLLHYFHGMMNCSETDCKLKTHVTKECKDVEESDISKAETPCTDQRRETSVIRSDSTGIRCPGRAEKRRVSTERCRKNSAKDDDEVFVDVDVHDDCGSSSSDQTVPYCDGQPLVGWELDTVRKERNSVGEQDIISNVLSSCGFTKKFRRHSSESEPRSRRIRDSDHSHQNHLSASPDNLLLEESSPMLPPLPVYASPFTPGSMYNVPMDNERVLLECFSAPGSQAPSSVRSAPSVRLPSPDRQDHPHLEDDIFATLFNPKSVSDNDYVSSRRDSQSSQRRTSLKISGRDSETPTCEQICEGKHLTGNEKRPESADDHYHDFTDDFNVEDPDDDDVFIDNETESNKGCPRAIESGYSETKKASVFTPIKHLKPHENVPLSDSIDNTKSVKEIPDSLTKITACQKNNMIINYVETSDCGVLSPVCKNNSGGLAEIQSVKGSVPSNNSGHTTKHFVDELQEKLSKVPVQNCETTFDSAGVHETIMEQVSLKNNPGSINEDSSKNSSSSPHKTDLNHASVKDHTGSTHVADGLVCKGEKLFTEESDVPEDRATSDATFAYGASDEGTDTQSGKDVSTDRVKSQTSSEILKLDTLCDRAETNIPHTSSPRSEPVLNEDVLETWNEDRESVKFLEDELVDKRRPPLEFEDSLEDRVQTFIDNGSHFTPRAVVRSNSLPVLCGMENMVSPIQESEDNVHTPRVITSRSNSYPGAIPSNDCASSVGQSSAPSPVAPLLDESAASEKDENMSIISSPPNTCSASEETAQETEQTSSVASETAAAAAAECGEHLFLEPCSVVDGGEVTTRTTPRHSPDTGVVADSGDQLLQWAAPCALHGAAFCACEGIDIHTARDAPSASPKVGPWLCTPGTPIPGTPFCDYSKLIYSPFPVVGGMTPARSEVHDSPASSPKPLPASDVDLYSCGAKRLASPEGQPAPKRRSITPCKAGDVSGSPPCRDKDTVGMDCEGSSPCKNGDSIACESSLPCKDEDSVGLTCEGSPPCKDMQSVDINGEVSPPHQVADDLFQEQGFSGNHMSCTMATAEEDDKLFSENEEQELIAAAEESEKAMANLTPEERQQLQSTSPGISAIEETAVGVSDDRLSEWNSMQVVSDCAAAESQALQTCASADPSNEIVTADLEVSDNSLVLESEPNEKTMPDNLNLMSESNTETIPDNLVSCENTETLNPNSLALISDTNNTTIPEIVSEAKCPVSEENAAVSNSTSNINGSEESRVKPLPQTHETVEESTHVFKDSPTQLTEVDCETSGREALEEMAMTVTAEDNKPHSILPTLTDISDTNSVGTTDSESVNDVRIITLGDSDIDLTFESEDSKESTESPLPPKVSEVVSKPPSLEGKKIITIAEYKERRKHLVECKNTNLTSGASAPSSHSDCKIKRESKTDSKDKAERLTVSPKRLSLPYCTEAKKHEPAEGTVPKVLRTESVPAELSRKVTAELKRSSSFHGQHPTIKRFKHERDDSLDTVKAELKRHAHGSRAASERKPSLQCPPKEKSPRVKNETHVTKTPSPLKCADTTEKTKKERKKERRKESSPKAAHESRRTETRRDSSDVKRAKTSTPGNRTSRSASSVSEHSNLTKQKGLTTDQHLISRCSDTLKPCSVVVSKIRHFPFKCTAKLKEAAAAEEDQANQQEDSFIVESETISITCQREPSTSRLPNIPPDTSPHMERMSESPEDEHQQTLTEDAGNSQSPLPPPPTRDEPPSQHIPRPQTASTPCWEQESMSEGEPDSPSVDIDVDQDKEIETELSPDCDDPCLTESSARTRKYVPRRKNTPKASSKNKRQINSHQVSPKPSPTTPVIETHSADDTTQKSAAQRQERPVSSNLPLETADDGEGVSKENGGGGGASEMDKQLADQLAELLKEKERMLAEFAKRNQELEQKLQGLRVELQETKKNGD